MGKTNVLLVLLIVIGLVMFGCTGGSTPTGDKKVQETKNGNAGQDIPVNGSKTETASEGNPADNFLGKGYAELAALGVPLDCDVRTKDANGKEASIKLYMKGQKFKSTAKGDIGGSGCSGFTTILVDNVAYMGCETGELLQSCKWLKMDLTKAKDSTGNALASSATTSDSLSKIPKTDISCKPGLFGDEIFVVSGKVCDLSDMFKNLGGSGGTGDNGNGGTSGETIPIPE